MSLGNLGSLGVGFGHLADLGGASNSRLYSFLGGSLPSGITGSGATNGTRYNSSGLLEAQTTPRFDYTPSTHAIRGLIVEPGTTEYVLRNTTLSNAAWTGNNCSITANSATGPDGTNSAFLITPTGTGFHDWRQIATIGSNLRAMVVSVIVKAAGYQYFSFGVADGTGFTAEASCVIDTSTGIVTNKTALGWTINAKGSVDLGNGWWLAWVNVTIGANIGIAILAPTPNSNGATGSYTASGSGGYCYGIDIEGAASTSAIPSSFIQGTAGTVLNRTPDLISVPVPWPNAKVTLGFDDATSQINWASAAGYSIPTNLLVGKRLQSMRLDRIAPTVPLIFFEGDLCADIDDVTAIQVLLYQAQLGGCQIIGANVNTSNSYAAPCLAGMLNWSGFGYVPIGAYLGGSTLPNPATSAYTQSVASRFGVSGLTDKTNFISGSDNLRRCLAAAPDNSVTILSTGFLTNLAAMLQSTADGYSSLTGLQLFTAKVRRVVIMGGTYTSGTEYNFSTDATSAAYFINNCPATIPIYGVDSVLGGSITFTFPSGANGNSSPFSYAYGLFGGSSRQSWDPVAALFATEAYSSSFNVQGGGNGTNTVNSGTGANAWTSTAGNYSYLGNAVSTATIAATITAIAKAIT